MLNGLRVLVVEDEWLIATELALVVEDERGRTVGPVRSKRDAFRLLASEEIDAAILDVNLADGDVTPLAEHLIGRGIPIVLFTGGFVPKSIRERYARVPILEKPAPYEDIVSAILASVGADRVDAPVAA